MEEDYPRTLLELERRFSTEQACREYLFDLRWPDGFRCPRCEAGKSWALQSGRVQCAHCGYQVSMTAGTVFQGTRTPLTVWFRAMWWLTSQKERGERGSVAACARLGQLSDGMDVFA